MLMYIFGVLVIFFEILLKNASLAKNLNRQFVTIENLISTERYGYTTLVLSVYRLAAMTFRFDSAFMRSSFRISMS